MSRRIQRINKLFCDFITNLGNETIASYFQIDHSKYTLTKWTDDVYLFKVICESFPKYVFPLLPIELSMKISSFLYTKDVIEYSVFFTMDYPFKPTKWLLLGSAQPSPDKYKAAMYYQNKRYDESWSPAITIEKDILNMIDSIELMS